MVLVQGFDMPENYEWGKMSDSEYTDQMSTIIRRMSDMNPEMHEGLEIEAYAKGRVV